VSNFSAWPDSIVNILILNTSDGSTVLNEIQGCGCREHNSKKQSYSHFGKTGKYRGERFNSPTLYLYTASTPAHRSRVPMCDLIILIIARQCSPRGRRPGCGGTPCPSEPRCRLLQLQSEFDLPSDRMRSGVTALGEDGVLAFALDCLQRIVDGGGEYFAVGQA
jgi:hypothetical protein